MSKQVSRVQGRAFLVGIASLVVLGLVGYVMFTANQGRLPWTGTRTVKAAFSNIGQLNTSFDVRINSVRVGQVSDISVVGRKAVVTMDLNTEEPIYANASAALWDQSALGQKFVELNPGTPGAGRLGNRPIPSSRTDSAHDLSDVLQVFDPPTRQALAGSLRSLGGGLGGHGGDLNDFLGTSPRLLGDVDSVSHALASPDAELPELLGTTERFLGRFNGKYADTASLLRQTGTTLAAVNAERSRPLADTIAKLPGTLRTANSALDTLDQPLGDTRSAMLSLRPGGQALGAATGDFRGVLRESLTPLRRLPGVAEQTYPSLGALTGTFHAARPVVPKIADGLNDAAQPLGVLSRYGCDIGTFSFDIGNLITNHVDWRHRLRLGLAAPSSTSVTGLTPESRNPYPEPCSVNSDRAALGGQVPTLGGGVR
jgi:phospholipid/cholesterol/gamma-HCH transport system substrate-binding protein